MKRSLTFGLLLALAISTIGCGKKDTTSNDDDSGGSTPKKVEMPPPAKVAVKEGEAGYQPKKSIFVKLGKTMAKTVGIDGKTAKAETPKIDPPKTP